MRFVLYFGLGASCLLSGAWQTAAGEAAQDEGLLQDARIPTDGAGLLTFFKQRILAGAADEGRLRVLIKQLGDDDFLQRESACRQLVALGIRARAALHQAVESPDIEVVRRAEDCLQKIDRGAAGTVVAAGVRTLARRNPPGTVATLLAFLPAAEDDLVVEEIQTALASLAVHDGTADPALVTALADASPLKRVAAAVALCRANAAGSMPAVRKLLDDSDPLVRMRLGLALAERRDKDVVPILIGVLPSLKPRERGMVVNFLTRLAEESGPDLVAGNDDASLKRLTAAWQDWWQRVGPKLDPARLAEVSSTLNCTLVVLLDTGQIVDLDSRNRPRWQFGGLEFPLDAQLLPGDHVLVAEHKANRVTERNRKGEILWEIKVEQPLAAQRLANGRTFVATMLQLLEYDKNGRQVFNYQHPDGESFMKAQRLRNGDIACVVQGGIAPRYVRLNSAGQELKSFPVRLSTRGGRIEVLANGHVLVPDMDTNRVVEHDADGRVVGTPLPAEDPIAAVRLPNGNTVVTSMSGKRAVELGPDGKEVWTYRTNTRVTRAYRR